MKLIISFLSFLLFPLISLAYDFQVGDLYFNILSAKDQTCETSQGENFMCMLEGELTIPSQVEYQGKLWTVTAIGETSFAWSKLTKVVLPNTIETIKSHAFVKCFQLQHIQLPTSLSRIESAAFQECSYLNEISLPNGIVDIPTYCFMDCYSLTEIV